jgi:flavin reductase (DIM6/NTAB) family NADH-FMN oxidoreductase RutF
MKPMEPASGDAAGLRAAFLDSMSRVAFSVSVVTTDGPSGRCGVTVTAMSSVSIDAEGPTLMVSLHHRGRAAKVIAENGCFCVNVLADSQVHLAERFAGRSSVRDVSPFAGLDVLASPSGLPLLPDAIASFDCRVRSIVPMDEHLVVFGLVLATGARSEAAPLLHRRRSYWGMGAGIVR